MARSRSSGSGAAGSRPTGSPPSDARRRVAGRRAEQQMAFYLHRAFGRDPEIHVLDDLRIVDPEQPEADGRPGVAQVDHLIVHRRGLVIVESKSVHDRVTVRDDGSGRDAWTRRVGGREHGFPSPIRQAERQAELLRTFLQRHRERLLGRMSVGLRTLSRLVHGTDQRGFRSMPIQIVVAISDGGTIRRVGGWTEPAEPFRTFVTKADLVPDVVRAELARHHEGGRLLGEDRGAYGLWSMSDEEAANVVAFLRDQHVPREPRPRADAATESPTGPGHATTTALPASPTASESAARASDVTPRCRGCGGTRLHAHWGRYGYFWSCDDCDATTSMPTTCGACGAQDHRGRVVRIRKRGPEYVRGCEACGLDERIWREG